VVTRGHEHFEPAVSACFINSPFFQLLPSTGATPWLGEGVLGGVAGDRPMAGGEVVQSHVRLFCRTGQDNDLFPP